MKCKLWKVSSPGWALESDNLDIIHLVLENHICKSCFMSEKEFLSDLEENLENGNIDLQEYEESVEYFEPHCPDNYDSLSVIDKIDWMLGTPCGIEYYFEEIKESYKQW